MSYEEIRKIWINYDCLKLLTDMFYKEKICFVISFLSIYLKVTFLVATQGETRGGLGPKTSPSQIFYMFIILAPPN